MKKIIFLAAGLLFAGAVNAQIKFGVAGGVNFSNIIKTDDPNFTTDYRTGFNAGVTMDIHLIGPLSFDPEILYSTKGYKAHTTSGEFNQRTNFIDAPLLAKLKVAPGFGIIVGPQISFLMSTTNTFSNGFSTVQQQHYEDDSNRFRKSLIDGVLGLNIDLGSNVDLRARYTIDLQQNNADETSQTPQYRNQVWQIGLGFKIP
ncbi:porin family protein [Mucilaginibacter sp. AW1-3]